MKTSSRTDPWSDIPVPSDEQAANTRLIADRNLPEGVRAEWAKFCGGAVGLSFTYPVGEESKNAKLTFKGFDVVSRYKVDKCTSGTQIILREKRMQELFLHLCRDVIGSIEAVKPHKVHDRIIGRLEKWHYLLSARNGSLTKNEQKGLVGELAFLERVVLAELSASQAVETWTGPLRAPRDFTLGNDLFEIKANRGSGDQSVRISSEYQLSTKDGETLYLCVIPINEDPAHGLSLDEYVHGIRETLEENIKAMDEFELRLAAAGYSDAHDYKDTKWSRGSFSYYMVEGDFPRLEASKLPAGVSDVVYKLDLNRLEEYLVEESEIKERVGGQRG